MPESKTRHPHKHPQHHSKAPEVHQPKSKKMSKAVIATVLFCGLLGLGVSFFIAADSITTLIVGTLVGVVVGFIFGYEVDKNLSKK
jgi:membrane associated rhomboid family serine protease